MMPGRPRRSRVRGLTRGRKPLLTPEAQAIILTLIGKGNKLWVAAEKAGLKPDTVQNWWLRGKDDGPEPYNSFYRALLGAIADRRVLLQEYNDHHAATDPKVAKAEEDMWAAFVDDPQAPLMLEGGGPTLPEIPANTTNYIVITPEEVDAIVDRNLAEERGDADLDDATRARRARLVTDLSEA